MSQRTETVRKPTRCCDRTIPSDAARVAGSRFAPGGALGYRAHDVEGAPVRSTRAAAEEDWHSDRCERPRAEAFALLLGHASALLGDLACSPRSTFEEAHARLDAVLAAQPGADGIVVYRRGGTWRSHAGVRAETVLTRFAARFATSDPLTMALAAEPEESAA